MADKPDFAPKPDSCIGCPLYNTGEGFAYGHGPVDAKIMFVGEALGEDEAYAGRPFVGGAGRVLTRLCSLGGIRRDSTYITNIVKCRPPNNRVPTTGEIAYCAQYLKQELVTVGANVIVALGGTALGALTGLQSIMLHRGVPLQHGGRKVIGTMHPAALMRQQDYWPVVIHDFRRIQKESHFPEVIRAEVSYNLGARASTSGEALIRAAKESGYVGFDIESTGLSFRDDQVVCIGFGPKPYNAEVYPWNPETDALTSAIAGDPDIEKIGQNSEQFDIPFLEEKGITFRGKSFDTMIAFHLTNSSLPKDLGFISSFYTDMEYWKDQAGENLFLYNARDVDGTVRTALGLKKELKSLGMEDLYYKNVAPVQSVLRTMGRRGLKKNEGKAALWAKLILARCDEKERDLRQGLGQADFSVQSPKQLMHLLYDVMGLPVQYAKDPKTKAMRPTANAAAMDKLAELTDNKIFHLINDIRSSRQQVSTFLMVETDEHGYVHPKFGTAKAANGRLNCVDPNAQNQPPSLREIYEPDDEDHVILASDWSQIEWRLSLVLSGDPIGLALMASGLDNHSAVYAETHGLSIEDVKPEQRQEAKFIIYGLLYGRGVESIAQKHGIPVPRVEDFIRNFKKRFSAYWNWRDDLPRFVFQESYLRNPFGRRRWWYDRKVTEMYNFPPSSTAADMMIVVLPKLEEQMPSGASLRLTVHDEVVVVVHKDVVRQAVECVRDIMQRKWDIITQASMFPRNVRKHYPDGWWCPADVHLGNNWKESKKGNKELEKYLLGEAL